MITGAASGIGKACAQRLAKEGYGVVVADVNMAAEALVRELTGEGLSAIAVHMDVADEQEGEAGFGKMVETYGSCDLVMSNAGIQIVYPFDEYPFSDWKKMMAIHADGAFLVARAAFRRMKASGKGGRIVFTGSVQSFVGSKLKEPYNFAKHGVAGLAKAVAREGAEYGIYTYTICPSFIKTPLVEKQIPEQARDLGITEEEVVKNIMLRDTVDSQFTTVEDVANMLGFLVNRFAQALFRESIYLIEQGVTTAADIDKAVKYAMGMRYASIGLLEYFDAVGYFLESTIAQNVYPDLCDTKEIQDLVKAGLASGKTGQAAGQGLYDWSKKDADDFRRRKQSPYFDGVKDWTMPE